MGTRKRTYGSIAKIRAEVSNFVFSHGIFS